MCLLGSVTRAVLLALIAVWKKSGWTKVVWMCGKKTHHLE